jgi:hypothetical protein
MPAPTEVTAFSCTDDDASEAPRVAAPPVDVEADTPAQAVEVATAPASDPDLCDEIEVIYEDESSQPSSVGAMESVPALGDESSESPASATASALDDACDVLMEWVARDEDIVECEPVMEIESEPAAGDFGFACNSGSDRATDLCELADEHDDLGVIEWIKCGEPLTETPCEVPFPRSAPREERSIRKSLAPLWPAVSTAEVDAIDAGWELEPEVLPHVAAAAEAPVEPDPITTTPPPYQPRRSDVTELLAGFTVAESRSLREMSRELKLIAGVSVTPVPPGMTRPSGDGS